MNRIIIICVSVLILPISMFAQGESKLCPAIQLTAPVNITNPGETMIFSVKVENENLNLIYEWTVSEGTIIEGQNTPIIRIVTTPAMNGGRVTAKITIQNLPANCNKEISETALIADLPLDCGLAFEDYGDISSNEEKGRLDNVFTQLFNNPEAVAFFQLVTEKNETGEQTKKRIKKIIDHTRFRKFDEKRLVFAIDKSGTYGFEQRTFIHLVPEIKEFPECENCEIIKGEDVK